MKVKRKNRSLRISQGEGINARRAFRKDCAVIAEGKEGTPLENLLTVDISSTGMGVISDKYIPIGNNHLTHTVIFL